MKPKHISVLAVSYVIFSIYLASVTSDLESDRRALLALRAGVGGRPLLWNVSAGPCSWDGVHCASGRVTELRLPGRGLSGPLPLAIGNLTQLQTLSLRYNSLSGPIPKDFANLTLLRYLYLHVNSFSGDIPTFLFTLPRLIRLSLGRNNFSGSIPDNVNKASRLATLYLQENQLIGSIPDITLTLQQFNVSFNHLNGSIPSRLSGMPKEAFDGNSLCGKPLSPCVGEGGEKKDSKLSGGAIAGIVIACVFGLLSILLILFFLCRKGKNNENIESRNVVTAPTSPATAKQTVADVPAAKAPETGNRGKSVSKEEKTGVISKDLIFFVKSFGSFDLDGLLKASAEVLGKGTSGSSYKASFDHGLVVAAKRLRDVVGTEKEFRDRMEMVGSMSHENLVTLIAYYFGRDEKLLVYDYMTRGSLSALLHGSKGSGRTPLNWETRAHVALGTASAIAYIHARDATTSHGNIKSSNVLLSESNGAKVSDFCLAPLINPTSAPNRLDGYRAPEVTDARKISQKADVYSFGVLLLELLTGKSPTHQQLNEEGVDLPRWVQSVVEQQSPHDVFDPELIRYQSEGNEKMIRLLKLAISCTAQYPDKRPSMAQVTILIEEISTGLSSE